MGLAGSVAADQPLNPAQSTPADKLNPLTSLRFLAAGLILLHHVKGKFGVPAEVAGNFVLGTGVSFFFVLSGFILTYVYSRRPRLDAGRFLLARIARLWPAHVTALVVFGLLLHGTPVPEFSPKLLANLALVHAWIPSFDYNFSYVPASWSISTEAGFYLCFILFISNWARSWHWKLALAVLAMLGMVYLVNHGADAITPDRQQLATVLVQVNPLGRLLEFTLGMVTALAWFRYAPRITMPVAGATLLELAAFALAVLAMSKSAEWSALAGRVDWIGLGGRNWLMRSGIVCLPFAFLIFAMAMNAGLLSRFLSLAFLVLLGELSYSAYLLHQPVYAWAQQYAMLYASMPVPIVLAWVLLVVLTLSYLSWACIERPLRHFLVGLWPAHRAGPAMTEPQAPRSGVAGAVAHRAGVAPSERGMVIAACLFLGLMVPAVVLVNAGRGLDMAPAVVPVNAGRGLDQISGEEAARPVRESGAVRDIRFGDDLLLLGVVGRRDGKVLELQMVWKSLAETPLEDMIFIQFLDGTGRILGQTRQAQDNTTSRVPEGRIWKDTVRIPLTRLKQAERFGIALRNDAANRFQPIDSGPRDWGNHRLLVDLDTLLAAAE